jgi:hypothetical protein
MASAMKRRMSAVSIKLAYVAGSGGGAERGGGNGVSGEIMKLRESVAQ